jgi:hypothetical protein
LLVIGLCGCSRGNPAKELAAIDNDWSEAEKTFERSTQEAKTEEARRQVLQEKAAKVTDIAGRYVRLALTRPDSPEALTALLWVVRNERPCPLHQQAQSLLKEKLSQLRDRLAAVTDLDQLDQTVAGLSIPGFEDLAPLVAERARENLDHPKAVPLLLWVCEATRTRPRPELGSLYNDTVALLVRRFAERKELEPLLDLLARDDDPEWAEKQLRPLVAKNPAKAHARLALGLVLKNLDLAAQPEAEQLLAAAVQELSTQPGKSRLAELARRELDDLKVRDIGKPAPDVAGPDLDGKEFKLSDYRGKVVLLDFWAFW